MKTYLPIIFALVLFASCAIAGTVYVFESSNQTGLTSTSISSPPPSEPSGSVPPCPLGQTIYYTTNGASPVCQENP